MRRTLKNRSKFTADEILRLKFLKDQKKRFKVLFKLWKNNFAENIFELQKHFLALNKKCFEGFKWS